MYSLTLCRLLSKPGIPKLRALAKDGISKNLRLKGKGHEFSDAAKLLNYFQLWLDDLYPRAKFADGLQMVEKVGHSKRMQVMRREWINESKRKELYGDGDDDMYGGQTNPVAENGARQDKNDAHNGERPPTGMDEDPNSDSLFFPDASKKQEARESDEPDDDELEALLAEQPTDPARQKLQHEPMMDDSEGEDDLDALFAEAERPNSFPKPAQNAVHESVEDDGDDLDALLAEKKSRAEPPSAPNLATRPEGDDLDALLTEEIGPPDVSTSRDVPDADDEDLDALMADY